MHVRQQMLLFSSICYYLSDLPQFRNRFPERKERGKGLSQLLLSERDGYRLRRCFCAVQGSNALFQARRLRECAIAARPALGNHSPARSGETPERFRCRRGRGNGPRSNARKSLGGETPLSRPSSLNRALQKEARRHFSRRARRGLPGLQRRPAPSFSSGPNAGGRRWRRSNRSLPPTMTSPSASRSPDCNCLLPLLRTDARGAWPRLPPRSPRLVRTGRSADGRRASFRRVGRWVDGERSAWVALAWTVKKAASFVTPMRT